MNPITFFERACRNELSDREVRCATFALTGGLFAFLVLLRLAP